MTVHSTTLSELSRAMEQAVSRRPLTAEARNRSRFSPCGICGKKEVALGQFFPRVLRFPPVSYIPLVLHDTAKKKKLTSFITGLHQNLKAVVRP
jgi:hypothetical protein